jgi:hypothetical protein
MTLNIPVTPSKLQIQVPLLIPQLTCNDKQTIRFKDKLLYEISNCLNWVLRWRMKMGMGLCAVRKGHGLHAIKVMVCGIQTSQIFYLT